MDTLSYLSNAEPSAISELYSQYKKDPSSVEEGWRKFFEGFEFAETNFPSLPNSGGGTINNKEFAVHNLINAYRNRGHLFTKTNPVRERRKHGPGLELANFDLTDADLDTNFKAGEQCGLGETTLRNIVDHLKCVYCQSIGVEFTYMRQPEKVQWMIDKLHVNSNHPDFSIEEKKQIFKKLNQASVFESYLHTRFPGQKRFSLEGAESLIPALDVLVEHSSLAGAEEFVIGMAHRGRLNVLANIFNKPYQEIFSEFVAKDYEEENFDGDVKYHLGFDKEVSTDNGKKVNITLCPNPSHLEAVNPVVEGISRQKLDHKYNNDYNKVVPILIHGDAAIAGQGVVYEVVQMASLDGFKTGGTIHIVINNQVGFTTNYTDGRSSIYCTDVAKVTLSPVFHVNGDDPEALVHVMKIAMDYRQRFHEDVFIDLLCYRKYGHNEGDEPKFTQPLLYKSIAKHKNPKDLYLESLIAEKVMTPAEGKAVADEYKDKLVAAFDESKKIENAHVDNFLAKAWEGVEYANKDSFDSSPTTGYDKQKLLKLAARLTAVPEGKKIFRKLEKILNDRASMVENNKLDWGMAEMLAYASVLDEDKPIRFTGQDVERGTFSHRHAIVKIEDSEEEYCHLNNLKENQAGKFEIYNSLLSEYGVLGYEYGYSLVNPHGLTIWEAQFGDFFNGAQIMIDQFISPGEDKWKTMSGLVMLLPHGYEGMGAEHSSARLERFLTLCAEENWQIVNCTTPANFFHAMRRQLAWKFRKPLVVFTPKSLLRSPDCISTIDDLANGSFQEVIDDTVADKKKIESVFLCQGKIYYELKAKAKEAGNDTTAFVRVEQMYPAPLGQLEKVMATYPNATRKGWVQEEPENMGALSFVSRMYTGLGLTEFIGKDSSSSPASGSSKRDALRQEEVIKKIFQPENSTVNA
jgi:2-oxoglutarate dehydrogenase E1 component